MKRVLTAAVLMAVLWVVIKKTSPAAFFALMAVGIGFAAWECYRLLETRGDRPFKLLGIAASLALAWSFLETRPVFSPTVPLVAATAAALVAALARRDTPETMLSTASSTLFPVLFVGLTLGTVVGLRARPGEDGTDTLLLLLVCVICSDTAAFYVGSAVGRRPMAPVLSPRKTWEGAAGGLLASIGGALLAHFWFYQRLTLGHALVLGVIVSAAGVLGDLAESMVKRAAGAKDSSALLPGHGGFLDRVDSLLLAGPALYYYYRIFLEASP
ncbi:MAG: phosphatidate cytidylyltransferase [Acidobacteriia bacterium]|nr:phosphatidate cytidylyltransferase [Terriglobia bacterium]